MNRAKQYINAAKVHLAEVYRRPDMHEKSRIGRLHKAQLLLEIAVQIMEYEPQTTEQLTPLGEILAFTPRKESKNV